MISNERGSAMVTTIFFLVGLVIAASVVAMVATSEKRVMQNDYTHSRSFNASDAGSEAAINWLRMATRPPSIVDAQNRTVKDVAYTPLVVSGLTEKNEFKYDISYDRARYRPGWSKEFRDLDYTIDSEGASAKESSAIVEVEASRLFRLEY